jgi:hypothetical protein
MIGAVPESRLAGKPLTRKEKAEGYDGLLLPDLRWAASDRASVRALRKIGVRSVCYISFSIRIIPPSPRPKGKRSKLSGDEEQRRIWWKDSFLAKQPELAIYDSRGVRQRCIFADQKNPFRIEVCPNTRGVVEALEKEVRRIMERGTDAVFIDHVFGISKCHGEELDIHEHLYHEEDIRGIPVAQLRFAPGTDAPNDDPLSNFAYAMLLKRMRKVVQEYGKDKVLIGNTTFWPFKYAKEGKKFILFQPVIHRSVPGLFWRYLDCGMVESYMLVPKRFTSPTSKSRATVTWQTYADWAREAVIPEHYIELGRRLIALPYAGRSAKKDDLFFAFAAAKLDNMIWMGNDVRSSGRFCTFRLGRPTDVKRKRGAVQWRTYEHGLVALNPSGRAAAASVPAAWPALKDVYSGKTVSADRSRLSVHLPAKSGRVFLARPSNTRAPRLRR